MKRFLCFFATVIAASALLSCNKIVEIEQDVPTEEINGLKTVNFTVTGKVDYTLTKTYIEESAGTYLAHWSDASDEHLGIIFDGIVADMPCTVFDAFDITADIATFAGSATISEDNHTIHPFYPASAFNKTYNSGKIGLTLIREQHPVMGSFDPSADVMIGTDQAITIDDSDDILIENVVLERPMAVLRLHLKAKNDEAKAYGESVTSVEMTVADGKKLTGSFSYAPNDGEITWNTSNNSVKATFSDGTGNADQVLIDTDADLNSVYLVINPETLAEGTSITFDIETDVHSGINKISRTVTVPAGGMSFLAGKVNDIDLTVRDKDVPDVVVDTRILVESFDGVTASKTQAAADVTGVSGTGVSGSLVYTYGGSNTNIRFNSNGQSSDNPYLYFSLASDYFLIENIVVDNQTYLDFSAKVKNSATLTLQYKESSAVSWNDAGTYTGTGSFTDAVFSFVISNTVESLDLKLIASGSLIVDDLVLQPGSEPAHEISIKTNPSRIDLSGTSGTPTEITVVSNYAWTLSNTGSGYSISPTSGSAGETVVTITPTADGGGADIKLGDVTFTDSIDGVTSVTKDIYQLAKPVGLSLPYSYNDNSTNLTSSDVTKSGVGDYGTANAKIKYDGVGDYIIFHIASAASSFSINTCQNGSSSGSVLTLSGSVDGSSYTSIEAYTISQGQNKHATKSTTSINSSYRYLKLEMTTRESNVGVGVISIE